ncbi:hypothetical protein TIFTF001_032895 [Ficus carica]|uniref:Uncharacterized protein n=1 Tax=Ficus carica TaxID=3494 RepID=A0AA88DY27_FICCA|nr:hypothetical protein TIFTF001_032895 [Ficus carica]
MSGNTGRNTTTRFENDMNFVVSGWENRDRVTRKLTQEKTDRIQIRSACLCPVPSPLWLSTIVPHARPHLLQASETSEPELRNLPLPSPLGSGRLPSCASRGHALTSSKPVTCLLTLPLLIRTSFLPMPLPLPSH